MTHAGFVAGAYTLGLAIPLLFAGYAARRLSAARRRLAVLDHRVRPE